MQARPETGDRPLPCYVDDLATLQQDLASLCGAIAAVMDLPDGRGNVSSVLSSLVLLADTAERMAQVARDLEQRALSIRETLERHPAACQE